MTNKSNDNQIQPTTELRTTIQKPIEEALRDAEQILTEYAPDYKKMAK